MSGPSHPDERFDNPIERLRLAIALTSLTGIVLPVALGVALTT